MLQKTEKDLWVEMSIHEISTQALFAEIAYSRIDPKANADNNLVFSSIHSFLSHCAMISKMLKSTEDETPPKSIGSVLGIPSTSSIHMRVFRNHLEHYDERLKEWIRQYGVNSNIGNNNIGPRSAIQIPNMVFVSHYDPSNKNFTFVNDDFDLEKMHDEAQRIKELANDWVNGVRQGTIVVPFI